MCRKRGISIMSFFINSLVVPLPSVAFLLTHIGGRERRVIFHLLRTQFYPVHRLAEWDEKGCREK